jgi:uncharacterized protein (DUF58 family)
MHDVEKTSVASESPKTLVGWIRWRIDRRWYPPRRAIPTRAGLFALAAPIVLGVAAVNASNNLLFILLGGVLGAIVLSGIMSERNLYGVRTDVKQISPIYRGEPGRLLVTFSKDPEFALPSYALRLRERKSRSIFTGFRIRNLRSDLLVVTLPELSERSASKIGQRTFDARGRAALGFFELTTRHPFGLLVKARDTDVDAQILVRPKRVPVPAALADPASLAGDGEAPARRGLGLELYGLRERDDRDAFTRLHALRSLSLGFDVVIETDGVEQPIASLGIANVQGADPEAFERALEIASSVLNAWDERGYLVGLETATQRWPPGTASLDEMLDAIALLGLEGRIDHAPASALWIAPAGAEPVQDRTIAHVDRRGVVSLADRRGTVSVLPAKDERAEVR